MIGMGVAAHRVLVAYLCMIVFLSALGVRAGEGLLADPWSMSDDATTGAVVSDKTISQDFCFMLLRFYQKVLSVVTISHCPMIPSCSRYSMAAVEKHGPFVGVMMTADRLYHEGSERFWTPIVRDGGSTKFLDPVENNDFWWFHENK